MIMATKLALPPIDFTNKTVRIEVKLSTYDMRNVRRILGPKFEPLEDAWLVVQVKEKP